LLVESSTFSSVAARTTDLGAYCKGMGVWYRPECPPC
jgi:hypothetical protein